MGYDQPPDDNEQQQPQDAPPPWQPQEPRNDAPPPPPPPPQQQQYAPPPMQQPYGQQPYGQPPYGQQPYAPPPMQQQMGVPAQGYDWTIALILSILVGELGVDRFYTGSIMLGILKLITFGGCGVWWIIDIILIVTGSYKDALGRPLVRKM